MAEENDGDNKALRLWEGMQTEATDAFKQLYETKLQNVEKNRSLQLASDNTESVFIVQTGWLVSSKSTEDGQRQIVDFVLPGEVFDPGSANKRQSSTDVTALTRAKVSIIPRASWQRLLESNPELRTFLDRQMAASYSRMAERLLRVGKGQAETRIAYAISELCLRSTERGLPDEKEFHLPLTQQVLGDFVGLSSVHVSRTFRRLRRQKILRTDDHLDIVIEDVDRLSEIAEIDLDDLRAEIIPAA